MKILLATRNPGKAAELRSALAGLPIEVVSLAELGCDAPDPDETGATFAENAEIKARYWHARAGLPTLADDSGLVVDALLGELGVRTRRFGEERGHTTDEAWLAYFLGRMKGVPKEKRRAAFQIALCLVRSSSRRGEAGRGDAGTTVETFFFEAETRGSITETIEAEIISGIPASSVFRADGTEKVFAAMNHEEKNRWSHRGKAVAKLREFFEKLPPSPPQ